MEKNQLETIAKESQLPTTKSQRILEQFQGFFKTASEWEAKARAITVTDENQKAEMELAREGRLFLKNVRIAVEKTRVSLKAEALLETKAVDGMSNVLKALIVPIEEYLDKQEHFVEIREEAKREAKRQEIERRMEEEEAARVKAEAEKQEKIRQENIKLKKEAEERDKKDAIERKKRETRLANERAKAAAEREVIEKKLRVERAQAEDKIAKERKIAEEKAWIAESSAKIEREKAHKKAEAERKEKERLANILKNQILCPRCGHKFLPKRG